ncbi:MAG: ABC transporter permease, partial [Rubrimonas sp.]
MADAALPPSARQTAHTATGPLSAADGGSLKRKLARAQRRQRLRAFALVAPLLLFVVLTFLAPIGEMLFRSVENQIIPDNMPRTVQALRDWDPQTGELPEDDAFAAFIADMREMEAARTNSRVGQRLNYEASGFSSLFRQAGRGVRGIDDTRNPREALLELNRAFGQIETWAVMKQFSGRYTPDYFLGALDLQRDPIDGSIKAKTGLDAIYLFLFERTLWLSLAITATTLLLGYPVAWLLANLPMRTANLLMILVLLPFWTSLLVRTSAWIVLLQQNGVVNDLLVWSGVIAPDQRLRMIFNQTGVIVAMTHILLP